MPLDRTWYNTLVDEPPGGDGSVGSKWNKAAVDSLLDAVDAELVDTVPAALTTTGTVHNWAPGLHGDTFTRWAGAADLTVTGLAGGVAGQRWTFRNTGTKVATFAHLSGSSSTANQFTNAATSAPTPVAPGGWLTYEHDGATWILVAHEQGAWITPTFSAADYTAPTGTWVVAAGDVIECSYRLTGRTLMFRLWVLSTDVTGTPAYLARAIPGGFTGTGNDPVGFARVADAAGAAVGVVQAGAASFQANASVGGAAWSAGANRSVEFMKTIPVA